MWQKITPTFKIQKSLSLKMSFLQKITPYLLLFQVPVYVIEYEARQFRPDLHVRYHNSDPESETIKTYLWPALLEGQNGPCVQKGVVIT